MRSVAVLALLLLGVAANAAEVLHLRNAKFDDHDEEVASPLEDDANSPIDDALIDLDKEVNSEAVGEDELGFPGRKVKACWRDGESRGKGALPERETRECPAQKPDRSMGMCYPKCGEKRVGWGRLCWDDCQKMVYTNTGLVFCCDTPEICTGLVQTLASKMPKAIFQLAIDVASNPNNLRKILRDFRALAAGAAELRLPLCSTLGSEEGALAIEGEEEAADDEAPSGEEEEEEIVEDGEASEPETEHASPAAAEWLVSDW